MRDDAVDLWALDEVHFQQQGSPCRMWVPPETRDPIVYHHPTRKSVGYFAAVRLRDGEFLFRRETGRFNGESFWEFLKMFREASTVSGRRVLAISDNAQYHRSTLHLSWRNQQAPQFRLDFLPPTARNSTLSNGSGSSRAGCVCTIVTSDSSMESFPPSKISLPNGQSPTISCADYAQLLRTLCLTGHQGTGPALSTPDDKDASRLNTGNQGVRNCHNRDGRTRAGLIELSSSVQSRFPP